MPRESARIDRIFVLFKRLWNKYPDASFTGLLCNYLFKEEFSLNKDIWFVEDDDLEGRLSKEITNENIIDWDSSSIKSIILDKFFELWNKNGDMRFGQLFINYVIYGVHDDKILLISNDMILNVLNRE